MTFPRIIQLDAGHDRTVRFLSGLPMALSEGATRSWVTVTRTGHFSDPRYGEFDITRELLLSMVTNFDTKTYGQDIFIDVAHKPENGAAGKITKLEIQGDRLRALVEWTPLGVEAVRERGFAYLSAEYHENFRDNETGNVHGCVLLGAGLVTRPCIKRLDPVQLSEAAADPDGVAILLHPTLLSELITEAKNTMDKYLKQLEDALRARKLAEATITAYLDAAKKALSGMTDEAQMKSLVESLQATVVTLNENAPAPVINITGGGLNAADVQRILAEAAEAEADKQKKLAESLDGHKKLLAETINAATGLPEEVRGKLLADVCELITVAMSAEQVKKLAEHQVRQANEIAAAKQLAAMGYRVAGTPHISVDDSNSVKALQEVVDKRLGFDRMSDARRYVSTGGVLLEENKALADMVLAEFDANNGAQLHREHKMLAGGDGIVSDVNVPAIFERTVIREALYSLVSTQFMDVGTHPFSQVVSIPYGYRDTTAAGRSGTRTYEGQPIARAGIKQSLENTYPIPQKLSFEVSDELRYLLGNGQINYDPVMENAKNAIRVIREDTEQLNFNEILNASDEYSVAAGNDTLTATVNGTNKIFVTANFPVVRPRKVYDLQGNQVGSTSNPITVTLNSVARTEYNGTNTQASGTYWTMDYNLGELRFVTELGASVTPTNGWALVVTYSYTTNAYKFDTDLGSATLKDKWDDFLYRYGLRKAVIEDQRYYMPDFGVMSGTVKTMVEQAGTFAANFARPGTSLSAEGNLGIIKGVPNFKTTAPGLAIADQRIIIGERGVSRYRMLKAWTMNDLENQKDANGRFTGKKEAYGDQFIAVHTPLLLKGAYSSMVLYSATGRVARAS